jgi:hypothetical protein
MSITAVKEGHVLRVLSASGEIPEGQVLELIVTEDSPETRKERQAWLEAQMPSFIRGDEEESAEDLFPVI